MSMRRVCQEGIALLRRQSRNVELPSELQQRAFSSLPEDISQAARKAKFPARRHPRQENYLPGAAAAADSAASSSTAPGATPLNMAKEGAIIATNWMFPWERRQMEGAGGLRTWEKLYWGVFVVAISIFLFNRVRDWNEEEPEIDNSLEKLKEERARSVLAGATTLVPWGEDDPFDGMTPEEVQAFVEKTTGANATDPFEGMDPDEIDRYVKQHGMPTAQ